MAYRLSGDQGPGSHVFPFGTVDAGANNNFTGGFYEHAAADDTFAGGPTFGTANHMGGAHFFVVLGANTVDTLTLTVTGTSFTDGGTRSAADTENIVLTHPALVNDYFETTKKWIGAVVITVAGGTAKTCNYGWSKYWDQQNADFRLLSVEVLVMGDAADNAADFLVYHHRTTGWTFNGAAPATPPAAIYSMVTDYVTEIQIDNNEVSAWKRTGLTTNVNGAGSEGLIFCATQSTASPFGYGYFKIFTQPQ